MIGMILTNDFFGPSVSPGHSEGEIISLWTRIDKEDDVEGVREGGRQPLGVEDQVVV